MRRRNVVKIWLAVVCIVGLAASSALAAALSATVTTKQGTLTGTVTNDYREFLGVPYAAPPVGALRFMPPVDPADYPGGALTAQTPATACTQLGAGPGAPAILNEDCLYLNIYTPLKRKNLPVMVWIHGGGFINGAGSQYVGATLAKKGDVIVVTINYRLGVFGFLATPDLAAEPGNTSGNYGILDQQKALSWLKTNIANFGGDSNNITIFGGSAGAVSVATHIASPTSAGLFQRAIMESPLPGYVTATKDQNYAVGASIVGALGCTNAAVVLENACLRAASVDDLNNITPTIYMAQGMPTLPKVTIDGVTLETRIDWAIASGDFNQVPVLMGANEKEGAFLWAQTGITLDANSYVATVDAVYGALGPLVLATYPFPDPAYSDANDAFAALMGDSVVACPTRTLIRQLTTAGVPVYAYYFTDPEAPKDFPTLPGNMPTHGSEVLYVFQDTVPGFTDASALSPAQLKLSDKIISYWTNFARSGNPKGSPDWEEYSNKEDTFLELTSGKHGIKENTTYKAEHFCGFWAKYFGL